MIYEENGNLFSSTYLLIKLLSTNDTLYTMGVVRIIDPSKYIFHSPIYILFFNSSEFYLWQKNSAKKYIENSSTN